jgi:hypothetical protein
MRRIRREFAASVSLLVIAVTSDQAFCQADGGPAVAPVPIQPGPQEGAEERRSVDKPWTISLEPVLWWVSPSGKVKLPAGQGQPAGDEVRVEDLALDKPQFAPAGAMTINADDVRVSFSGTSYSSDKTTTADATFTLGDVSVIPGDEITTKFDFSVFDLLGGYRVYRNELRERSKDPGAASDLTLDVFALGGVRVLDVEFDFSEAGSPDTSSTQQLYAQPVVGLRSHLAIVRDFSIDLQVDGGWLGDSDRSSTTFNLTVGLGWRPDPLIGVEIGWRQVMYWLSDGQDEEEFSYNGAMAGVFVGVEVRF